MPTIPIEKLEAVRTIVTHAYCPDGIASARILRDVLPGREILYMTHNTPELAALPATEGMLFCDFCPPHDRLDAFRAVDTIVLDHHKSVREDVESFSLHVFADEALEPGVCGAVFL